VHQDGAEGKAPIRRAGRVTDATWTVTTMASPASGERCGPWEPLWEPDDPTGAAFQRTEPVGPQIETYGFVSVP
jgi:hypothetical protein